MTGPYIRQFGCLKGSVWWKQEINRKHVFIWVFCTLPALQLWSLEASLSTMQCCTVPSPMILYLSSLWEGNSSIGSGCQQNFGSAEQKEQSLFWVISQDSDVTTLCPSTGQPSCSSSESPSIPKLFLRGENTAISHQWSPWIFVLPTDCAVSH